MKRKSFHVDGVEIVRHGSYRAKALHTVSLSFNVRIKKMHSRDIQRDSS